ncbi:hypothetical protein VTL71DRAFT_1896 [Oculimacula yallundae]|uniref:Uncharacterized protein n=1 Tax=Oculimacula yallundae TaxID=86028 RepID=A0ABR4CDY3_9HELO
MLGYSHSEKWAGIWKESGGRLQRISSHPFKTMDVCYLIVTILLCTLMDGWMVGRIRLGYISPQFSRRLSGEKVI